MTPNKDHFLIAETKFRPYVEALLEGKQIEEVIEFLQNKAQTINKYSLANNTTESLLAYNEQFIKQIKIHY